MGLGRWLLVVMSVVLGAPHARAAGESKPDLSGVRFLANIKGRCTLAQIGDRDLTAACKPGVVSIGYKTSRLLYLFFVGTDVIGFSGETVRPPDFGHPSLDVTVITLGAERRLRATGQCRVVGVASEKATYHCEARSVDGTYRAALTVESEGQPTLTKDDEQPPRDAPPAAGPSEAHQATGQTGKVEEFRPSETQLRDYYAVYENGDVKYLRTVFSRAKPDDETTLLVEARAYVGGRFAVFSREPVLAGGVQLAIIFLDRPDAVWQAWVYDRKTAQDRYELRGFRRAALPSEELERIQKRYRRLLEDRDHSL